MNDVRLIFDLQNKRTNVEMVKPNNVNTPMCSREFKKDKYPVL